MVESQNSSGNKKIIISDQAKQVLELHSNNFQFISYFIKVPRLDEKIKLHIVQKRKQVLVRRRTKDEGKNT